MNGQSEKSGKIGVPIKRLADIKSTLAKSVTPAKAAVMKGVSRAAIYNAVKEGRLITHKVYGQVYIDLESLKTYQPDEQRRNAGVARGREPLMIKRLHERLGGTLVWEYPVVNDKAVDENGPTRELRRIDAIILPDGREPELKPSEVGDLKGRRVVVIQAKAHRLGPCLLGQAVWSPLLLETLHKAKIVRSIALCAAGDPRLEKLLKRHKVDLELDPEVEPTPEPSLTPDLSKIRRFWGSVGGTLVMRYPLGGGHTAHAIILPNREHKEAKVGEDVPVAGEYVMAITSRAKRLGMYALGKAYVSGELLKEKGPWEVDSMILVNDNDMALYPTLYEVKLGGKLPFADIEVAELGRETL